MEHPTRRQFVAGAAATTLSVIGLSSSTTADEGWADDGDEIERSDDLDELRKYQPYLRFDGGSPSKNQLIGIYGWKAESPHHDTDAYYYWARYTHQHAGVEHLGLFDRATGVLASDSHLWDHEPSITFVDPDTGEIEEVVYTQGHHSVARIDGDDAPLIADATDDPTHVSLRVIDPWHHYEPDDEESGVDVRNFAEFGSWLEVRDAWELNGFYDGSSREAIDNPWTARDRATWFEGRRDRLAARLWEVLSG